MSQLPILVAEDEPAVRRVIELLLAREGHVVVACADGDAALGLMQTREFGMLLTDLNLPGPNGLALAQFARACNPPLPVVVMSGQDTSGPMTLESAPDDIYRLAKPFKPHDLIALIDFVLALRRSQDRRTA